MHLLRKIFQSPILLVAWTEGMGSYCSLKCYSSSVLHDACGVHINPQQSLELDNLVHNNSTVINTEDQTSGR